MDQTFVMVKPDGVARGLIGEIVARLERKGLKMVAARFERLPEKRVMDHYREHLEKPFFPSLYHYITSGPCFLMIWEGRDAVSVVRGLVGKTNPADAGPGTIRGDLAMDIGRNIVHASDSQESAQREIGIHFSDDEVWPYKRADEQVLYE